MCVYTTRYIDSITLIDLTMLWLSSVLVKHTSILNVISLNNHPSCDTRLSNPT